MIKKKLINKKGGCGGYPPVPQKSIIFMAFFNSVKALNMVEREGP
jgi:hypothetical protein